MRINGELPYLGHQEPPRGRVILATVNGDIYIFYSLCICNHLGCMRSPLWLDMAALVRALRAGRALRGLGSGKRGKVTGLRANSGLVHNRYVLKS